MKLPEILQDPWLLRAAFARVERWHWMADAAPWAQLQAFRLEPIRYLGRLCDALKDGTYEPKVWPMVPVPKTNGDIRPYFVPDVADHVVGMAFAILLAPAIERGLKPFVFGNRWHRPLTRARAGHIESKSGQGKNRWQQRPFVLHAQETFLPYRRDYGLFRRVCHWTASAAVRGRAVDEEVSRWASKPEHYESSRIPPFTKNSWWSAAKTGRQAYWSRVDIASFFSSVSLENLRKPLGLLNDDEKETSYQEFADLGIEVPQVSTIGEAAIDWLSTWQVTQSCDPQQMPSGCTSREQLGLPTGLALSALLSHVALTDVDLHLAETIKARETAILRFVDDFVIVTRSPEQTIEQSLLLQARLGQAGTRLCLKKEKTSPLGLLTDAKPDVVHALRKASITQDADPFVTTVVERLSELGREDPFAIVGLAGKQRIQELHLLGRTHMHDPLMNRETVAAFAAGRLARSFPTSTQNRGEVEAIRSTIAQVLTEHPFKPGMWTWVVKAAARRPFDAGSEDETIAADWLKRLLRPYALGAEDEQNYWWPSPQKHSENQAHAVAKTSRSPSHQLDVVSFLRASFWNALASVLDALDRPGAPGPASWVPRALEAPLRQESRTMLAACETWSSVLYPDNKTSPLKWWEKAAYARARLAATPADAANLSGAGSDAHIGPGHVPGTVPEHFAEVAMLGRARNGRPPDWLVTQPPLLRAALGRRMCVDVTVSAEEIGRIDANPLSIEAFGVARKAYLAALGAA